MSVRDTTGDEASTLPEKPEEVASSHLAIDKSLAAEEGKIFEKFFFGGNFEDSQISEMDIICEAPKTFPAGPSTHFLPKLGKIPITSPSKVECKVLDVDKLPKLSKWEVFKSKLYLGSAYGGTRMTTVAEPMNDLLNPKEGCSREADDMQGAMEGLNLDGLPPIPTQKSSKLLSWSKLKGIFGKKDGKEKDAEDEGDSASEV